MLERSLFSEGRMTREEVMLLIPSLEAAQKEAKTLLHNLQQQDVLPERYGQFNATDVSPARRSDAQYLVARYYGFKSWVALRASLSSAPWPRCKKRSGLRRDGENLEPRNSQSGCP